MSSILQLHYLISQGKHGRFKCQLLGHIQSRPLIDACWGSLWRRRVWGCVPALFCRGRKLYQQARMQWLGCGSLKWDSWWQQAKDSGPANGAAAITWTLSVFLLASPSCCQLGSYQNLVALLKKKINCLRKIMHHSEIEFWDSTQEGRVQIFFFPQWRVERKAEDETTFKDEKTI